MFSMLGVNVLILNYPAFHRDSMYVHIRCIEQRCRNRLTTMWLPEPMQQLIFDKLMEEAVNIVTATYRYVNIRIYLQSDNNRTFLKATNKWNNDYWLIETLNELLWLCSLRRLTYDTIYFYRSLHAEIRWNKTYSAWAPKSHSPVLQEPTVAKDKCLSVADVWFIFLILHN